VATPPTTPGVPCARRNFDAVVQAPKPANENRSVEVPVCYRTEASTVATTRCALFGFLLVSLALAAYLSGVALAPLRWLVLDPALFRKLNEAVVWYSGIPLVAGSLLICWDLCTKVRKGDV
jgi:hypothetical protein